MKCIITTILFLSLFLPLHSQVTTPPTHIRQWLAGKRFRLVTREQLKDYDPRLYDLCASVFPTEPLHGYHFEPENK